MKDCVKTSPSNAGMEDVLLGFLHGGDNARLR